MRTIAVRVAVAQRRAGGYGGRMNPKFTITSRHHSSGCLPARLGLLTVAGLLLALAGCGRKPPAPEAAAPAAPARSAPDTHLPEGIAWFDGEVDAAFAAAKAADKPLFLYWGAEWCPPCAQIKATIFNQREFQERSRLFVPVYLDGDTPSAQKHGEQFGVVGYPTMILFSADGAEITRLPGGVDVDRYATILDVALNDARPVAQLVDAARKGAVLSQNDWRLLAYHSWSTDAGHTVPEAERIATFRQLSTRCPVELEADCARLYFQYLYAAADATGTGGKPLSGLERAEARERLLILLGKPSVQQSNVENLLYGASDTVGLLSDEGSPERGDLTTAWTKALDMLDAGEAGTALSAPERLNVIRARVQIAKLDAPGKALPALLLEQARSAVARVDAETKDGYAREAAINAAANLYWEADLDEEANRLLVTELTRSASPYYFMLALADLAQKAGREEEAVQWLARAYADAKGPATRFQWGASYLLGLLEMTPEDTQRIERAGLEVIGELDDSPDAFYQRTRMRLEELNGKLLDWGRSGERARVIETLRSRTAEICRGLPAGDEGRRNCEGFLKPALPATARA
jgi:thiol-disulfide isomerase/thioredoxin